MFNCTQCGEAHSFKFGDICEWCRNANAKDEDGELEILQSYPLAELPLDQLLRHNELMVRKIHRQLDSIDASAKRTVSILKAALTS